MVSNSEYRNLPSLKHEMSYDLKCLFLLGLVLENVVLSFHLVQRASLSPYKHVCVQMNTYMYTNESVKVTYNN